MTTLAAVEFALRDASRPLVVLGPSLGTSAVALWQDVVPYLSDDADVIGWDLPGHGADAENPGSADFDSLRIADLAAGVLDVVERAQKTRGDVGAPFWYAGVSAGGAVGLQLLLDEPHRVAGAVLLCTGAKIGEPEGWTARADLVAAAGTPTQVIGSASRWFGPGFIEAHPPVSLRLLGSLQTADRFGYAAVCRALADFDVRERLGEITAPVVAVAGAADDVTTVDTLREIADGVADGRLEVFDGVGHLAPAEAPEQTAAVLRALVLGGADGGSTATDAASTANETVGTPDGARTRDETKAAGMRVRREVLSDAHVDRAVERTTPFTADFQDLITRYAWGEIWTRPGLDRRMRSAVTLTALVAGGHWDELAMHVRAARRNGLAAEEIGEILLQTAIYCSVPSANHAFAVASEALADDVG